jgi:spore coat protein U-like protein
MIRSNPRLFVLFVLLCLSLWWLPASRAHADTNVTCTATMSNVTFGNVSFTDGSGSGNSASVNATLNYTCTNNVLLLPPDESVTACFNINAGVQSGSNFNPRQMTDSALDVLQFQLFQGASTSNWGSNSNTPGPFIASFTIPGALLGPTTHSGSATLRGTLVINQTTAPPSTSYQDQFTGTNTLIQVGSQAGDTAPATCIGGTSGNSFTFTVTATIVKGCSVTANPINFGAVPFNAINSTANSTLDVLCSNGTPYFVGLAPSDGSTTGAGKMKGTLTGNTDLVPYQLSSTPGPSGTVWGNTATSTSVGNGVAGTGSGLVKPITVYATAANANFTPDTYSDTVTVNVNY